MEKNKKFNIHRKAVAMTEYVIKTYLALIIICTLVLGIIHISGVYIIRKPNKIAEATVTNILKYENDEPGQMVLYEYKAANGKTYEGSFISSKYGNQNDKTTWKKMIR